MVESEQRFALSAADQWGDICLVCPICEFDYVHPTRLEADRGGDLVEIDADGVGFATRPRSVRGVVTTLEFVCEAGHRFSLSFRFHKGRTFIWCSRLANCAVTEGSWPRTIWRD